MRKPKQTVKMNHSKNYDENFRRQAVELAITSGKPYQEVAYDLGVDVTTLRDWRHRYAGQMNHLRAEPEKLSAEEMVREIKRLQQENAYLKKQREILKKAVSIVSEIELNGGMR